jgi:hypothetical protein
MSGTVEVGGISPLALLRALYEGAPVLGMGFLQTSGAPKSEEAWLVLFEDLANNARKWHHEELYVDYLFGRCMKVRIPLDAENKAPSEATIESYLYNRDAGAGAMERIVAKLRK